MGEVKRGYKFIVDDSDDQPFHCLTPGCGRKFKSEGAFNLHPHGSAYRKGRHQQNNKNREELSQNRCKECGGQKRMLSVKNPLEEAAMQAGYKYACTVCNEVYRD